MRRLATLTAATLLTVGLVTPAHAEEPTPSCSWETDRAAMFEELYNSYRVAHEDMTAIALQWQERAAQQSAQIERLRAKIQRLKGRLNERSR